MSTATSNGKTITESPFDVYLRGLSTMRCTPREFGDDMDLYALDKRYVLCGIGMPGVGKSATVTSRAMSRGAPFASSEHPEGPSLVLHTPQLGVDDLFLPSIPTEEIKTKTSRTLFYQRRVPLTWRRILEYVEEHGPAIMEGREKPPIVLIEEVNRPREKAVTSALFTLIEDRRVGDLHLPDAIQIVCLMNPSIGGMQVHPFEKDSASRRRVGFLGITASMPEWLQFAHAAKLHKTVIDFVSAHPSYFYDEKSLLAGQLFACPASWETVGHAAARCEKAGLGLDSPAFLRAATSKVGTAAAMALLEFARTRTTHVVPQDILDKYTEHSEVRSRVLDLIKKRTDVIADLALGVVAVLFAPVPSDRKPPRELAPRISQFMLDVPSDVTVQIFNRLNEEARTASGGQQYLRELGAACGHIPAYQEVQRRLIEARERVIAVQKASDSGPADPNSN